MKTESCTGLRGILFAVAVCLFFMGQAVRADFTFGEPVNLGATVNSSSLDALPCLSADGLSLYFVSNRPGGLGSQDIWVARRKTVDNPWGTPENLGPIVNSASSDYSVCLSTDGLSLYLSSNRSGNFELWVSSRETTAAPWSSPANLGLTVNSTRDDWSPFISADSLSLYFSSDRLGSWDLWVSTRQTVADPWGPPENLGASVNSSALDATPTVSPDGRVVMFQSNRSGGYGAMDIWMTYRTTPFEDWGQTVNLGPMINSPSADLNPNISVDGSMLYFNSNRPGGRGGEDLWQASILPVVDLNRDYRVDIDDLLILIEHWGQNETAYDMGPMPWGDGVVDAADLEVLMSYWEQELFDPHFLAHWKLDEVGGDVAYDSAGENDAAVIGDAVWQPGGGKVDGALQLEGDDYLDTQFSLNPSDPFSVFAWIKGVEPGQVIVSQEDGVDWLLTDAQGNLMTALVSGGRRAGDPLVSEVIVTDDSWHRIGFTWDGSNRRLYVDGVVVAEDTQSNLADASAGLYLGASSDLKVGTFWSGLIDDVRVYGRVVTP